jgi:Fic family protein
MFEPKFIISPSLAQKLIKIERLAADLQHLELKPTILAGLRETAKIHTIHYSTFIEGNRLTVAEVQTVINDGIHPTGRERDEGEVRGYHLALNQLLDWVDAERTITEGRVQRLHANVMADGKQANKPSPYREVQNVVRDAETRAIIYLPPEAPDVSMLMAELCEWLMSEEALELPAPIVAGLLHYQFVTIHPYIDGNGRTARLLTTWLMHRTGYGLGGIYSLEEHYVKNLGAYYAALSLGPSHNYYMGRVQADLTPWLEYFIDGVLKSFSAVAKHLEGNDLGSKATLISSRNYLDQRKRQFLELFNAGELIKARDLEEQFNIGSRAARDLAKKWVEEEFLEIINPSKKGRLYRVVSQS